jgi:hypothetical protein
MGERFSVCFQGWKNLIEQSYLYLCVFHIVLSPKNSVLIFNHAFSFQTDFHRREVTYEASGRQSVESIQICFKQNICASSDE